MLGDFSVLGIRYPRDKSGVVWQGGVCRWMDVGRGHGSSLKVRVGMDAAVPGRDVDEGRWVVWQSVGGIATLHRQSASVTAMYNTAGNGNNAASTR